jgi:hypothetical protein
MMLPVLTSLSLQLCAQVHADVANTLIRRVAAAEATVRVAGLVAELTVTGGSTAQLTPRGDGAAAAVVAAHHPASAAVSAAVPTGKEPQGDDAGTAGLRAVAAVAEFGAAAAAATVQPGPDRGWPVHRVSAASARLGLRGHASVFVGLGRIVTLHHLLIHFTPE